MKKILLSLPLILVSAAVVAGNFALTGQGTVTGATLDGKELIKSLEVYTGRLKFGGDGVQTSENKTASGRVVNIWNSNPDRRFRLELAEDKVNKHLDLTFLTEYDAYTPHRSRSVRAMLPFDIFAGADFTARVGRAGNVKIVKGKIPANLANGKALLPANCRQVALKSPEYGNLVIDFNVLGAGDFISDYSNGAIKGFGFLQKKGEYVEFSSGTTLPECGGHVGTKVRFYRGTDEDFAKYHAITMLSYTQEFPCRKVYAFGGNKVGKRYTVATADKNLQWIKGAPQVVPGAKDGAFYGAAAGKNGVLKISNLNKGLYWVTLGIGNYQQKQNRFSVAFNNVVMAENITVPNKKAMTITRAIWVDGNSAELKLTGNYLISSLGLVYVMSDLEDNSIRKTLWKIDGFEPAVVYRNEHYKPAVEYTTSCHTFVLPEPGKEAAGKIKAEAPLKNAGNPDRDGMKWRYKAKISAWGPGNQGTLNEYIQPAAMQKRFDELQSKGVNAILVSSMLSRHTYPASLQRASEALRKISDEAHKRNMKVIDHQDYTLLWNIDSGYRVASERIHEVNIALDSMQPAPQFCIMNPQFKSRYIKYLQDFIRDSKVDCLMIDEAHFYPHGCGCSYCREAFHRDTGLYLPVNELDERIGDKNDDLWKRYLIWHKRQVGNNWYDLKMAAREVNPDFSFMAYSTHYGFTSNWSSLALGLDLTEFARGVDFLGTEIMTRDVLYSHRGLIPFRKMKEVLTFEYKTPIFGLVYSMGDWDQGYFGWAVNNMNAQSTWETIVKCPSGKSDYPAFVADNMDYSVSRRVAEAALLFPIQSRDWNHGVSMLPELMGTAQVLEKLHIPYKMIGDMSLSKDKLKEFKLLFVGAANCLSDKQLAVIKEFARNGGTVITGATAAWQDEIGSIRSKWGFADVYGYDIVPVKFKKYQNLPESKNSLLHKYNVVPSSSGKYGSCRVTLYADAAKRVPAVLEKQYGKGKFIHHAAMLSSPLADGEYRWKSKYTFKLDKALEDFCKKLFRAEFANADCNFAVKAPEYIYSTWFRSADAEIVHLLNATGGNVKYGTTLLGKSLAEAFPAIKEDIVVTLPAMEIKQVYAVSPDFAGRKELKLQKKGKVMSVTLPKELLKAYTIIWFKK